ncbi:ABC transporter ATP-binding protein [Oceanibacterium hippocampi]|uniref:Galactose/methyl galactoside import ATP-binding protein MglA n=1 Tax=Oceanibacterium hippocampi TaxID=745714 RepID=A0A1Y5TZS7_9PROT|nr:ABC transporter ATP-binding protein [Oceanibacterium hippocampi]SLN74691.1 Galactose/methyl galactoside import ATP-binding protein MglA [Oceanibacterium hippocampi]
MSLPALELRQINKWFGPVHANRDVSFRVDRGTIHGIIGENGAGKSTLMSIVYGYYQADGGTILVNDKPCPIETPEDAIDAGIGMVHQHFMLVDTFTVLENVILGVEGGPVLRSGMAAARKELDRLERDYALQVDIDSMVGDLPVGLRQRVEILKALYRGAEILILDEPTGVLTPQEADHLFRILANLKEQGKTVILITHKLREIMAITDNVTVMRQGAVVANVPTADTTREKLAELMVGRSVLLRVEKKPVTPGEVVLSVRGLKVTDGAGVHRVKDVSFDVRAGEIVGIAGVSGNGQSELLEALAGMRPISGGEIVYKGKSIAASGKIGSPRDLRRIGMAHVPEDRHRAGLVLSFSANECTILGYHDDVAYNGGLFLDNKAMVRECARQEEAYDVRPQNPMLSASGFSGGNQQKLVLAREMERDPDLLLVGQPTRGVDIGAIEFIHRRLIEMRDAGKAVLLVSVELDEIMSLSDRIIVMFDGGIVGEVDQVGAEEATIGLMMAGERVAA